MHLQYQTGYEFMKLYFIPWPVLNVKNNFLLPLTYFYQNMPMRNQLLESLIVL